MTYNFEIAIPSFNRADIIANRTIKLLKEMKVPKRKIRIFLRDMEQLEQYKETIGNYKYELTGQSGILATRNYLRTYYHEKNGLQGVLFMDDDIEQFNTLDENNKLIPVENFMETLSQMFLTTEELGFRLFAPSAYNNNFYMKDKISTNLKYCIGAFMGLVIDKSKPCIHTDIDHFEDFLFSVEHFLEDGGVVRFEKYSIKTKYFELKGGICGSMGGLENRRKNMDENAKYMIDRYGNDICRLKMKKWGADLRLNYRYKRSISV